MGKSKRSLPENLEEELEEIDEKEKEEGRKSSLKSLGIWLAVIGLAYGGYTYATNQQQAGQAYNQQGPSITGQGYQGQATYPSQQSGASVSQPAGSYQPTGTPGQGSSSGGGCCGGGGGSGANIQWQNGQASGSTGQASVPTQTPVSTGK
ncbi:MAG: hypothetical protein M1548_03255 [Actinobacteria bacterium]|nr:hypothetical protein [Actinomycetota bacterium]